MKNYERRMAKQYRESQTQVAVAETPVPPVTIIPVKEPEVIVEPVQEEYAYLIENEYLDPFAKPLSTFSIDVDNASYTNTRRILNEGRLPDYDAVRIEEFINYFDYQYLKPTDKKPFAVDLETAECPWNKETKLVRIGLQGEVIKKEIMPPTNLVFLVDVSGSMQEENKLPLVKQSLKVLIENMRPSDHIAIVSYAGAAGLVLASTSCFEKEIINKAIDNL
ncbi:MAG: von Willebrand factor type A domain-containing protein, partial [Bacteroidia bacterium]|nr:von Willebrand factor type A domain-containing protein [Bacteroidia bacterium]